MNETIGTRISALRRAGGYTQEELAEKLGVTAQAVSKWECDNSCPDISLLPMLAKLLGVSTDTLLTGEVPPIVEQLPACNCKPFEQLMLRIHVISHKGDKVNCNLPLPLVKTAIGIGLNDGGFLNVDGVDIFNSVDWEQIIKLVEQGMVGRLIEVESHKGDIVEVYVE